MSEAVYTINARTTTGRLVIIGSVIAALALAWFGVRWQIANMLGDLTQPSQENALQIAEAAVSLSPRDPLPRWLFATKLKEEFDPESIDASIRSLE